MSQNTTIPTEFKNMHFFGEMDLNLTRSVDQIYKQAFKISEMCGYMVEYNKEVKDVSHEQIVLLGEDCHDSLQVENVINFISHKVHKLQKVVYRIGYEGLGRDQKQIKTMIQVFDYMLTDNGKDHDWKEIFNLKKFNEKNEKKEEKTQ